MGQPLISIIIPVYNAEQYLRRCFDSVLSQSFENFELLLIDDGSTDASGKICDEYAIRDERIRVYHKPNGGVSSARNVGLKEAIGEWIYFVDADDEVLPDGLQVLVDGISEEVEVVLCGFEKVADDGKIIFMREEHMDITKIISQEECLYAIFDNDFYGYYYLGWMCVWMFRRDYLISVNICFSDEIKIKEDTLFIAQYLCRVVKKCYFTSRAVYRYYESKTSIMSVAKSRWEPKYITSYQACVMILNEICKIYPSGHPIIELSKESIWNRYYIIKDRVRRYNPSAKNILLELIIQSVQNTGLHYSIKYQVARSKRRIKKIIKRTLK